MLPTEILYDRNISTRSKGLYALIRDLQKEGFKVTRDLILENVPEGITAVVSSLRELQEHGYLKITEARDDNGRLAYFYELNNKEED